ncbi:MAG TPA: nucleotidyltransferase domain-containing protein [Acetobacteraceae bacterium]|nr:nucleotidyltransferase domain-containing protein [Acetobacteraceae bacterium]
MSATLPSALQLDLAALAEACRANYVRSLDLFGSATTDAFDPESSDIDLLVDFDLPEDKSVLDSYFNLQTALEAIFKRKVDLIFDGEFKNPYFRAAVERQRRHLYP